ncbi:MAG: aspartyl/asparaginyl beta-hydroxylase domain-containing protein [Bdellovibrionales bacterium]|jgi:hypothetical protein|nr:aspartyl/asparaginyl beta-hydroxylase domain-containing protein [Bdellovibrionales bacterium]
MNVNLERLSLFQQLHIYGDLIPLQATVDTDALERELEPFSEKWIQYNPKKTNNPRMGLSVTSLDGGMSGVPDLYSIYEWSKETGKKVSERDFNQPTDAYRACRSIHHLVEPFLPDVGRCRFVKFQPGGHFPPHRDGSVSYVVPDYFRILVPLTNTSADTFHFILDGKLVAYEPGRAYLFNALKTHSVVSFAPDVLTLAVSVALTQENVTKAVRMFKVY